MSQFKELLSKRVVLITGKGGVGRSTVSAAIARAAAQAGRRVLVTEIADPSQTEPGHFSPLARLFGRDRLPVERETLAPGVRGGVLEALKGHELFLGSVFRIKALAHAALASEALRRLFVAAPSLREIGVFYHLLTDLRQQRPDGSPENELIVVDMPATGHTLALTGLPKIFLAMVSRGPIAEALREGQSYLTDPAKAAAFIVTLPETLPVSETIELLAGLNDTGMPAGGVIVNRVSADPFTAGERAALEPLLSGRELWGDESFRYHVDCARALERLAREISVPLLRLPEAPAGEMPVSFLASKLGESL